MHSKKYAVISCLTRKTDLVLRVRDNIPEDMFELRLKGYIRS